MSHIQPAKRIAEAATCLDWFKDPLKAAGLTEAERAIAADHAGTLHSFARALAGDRAGELYPTEGAPECGDALTAQPCRNASAGNCGHCPILEIESEGGHAD